MRAEEKGEVACGSGVIRSQMELELDENFLGMLPPLEKPQTKKKNKYIYIYMLKSLFLIILFNTSVTLLKYKWK